VGGGGQEGGGERGVTHAFTRSQVSKTAMVEQGGAHRKGDTHTAARHARNPEKG
jgi:hypothetical protein